MNIAITGLTASGKTYQAKKLAEALGFTYFNAASYLISTIYGDKGVSLKSNEQLWLKENEVVYIESQRAKTNLDKQLDEMQIQMAQNKKNYVFDTRTLPWLYKGNNLIKIFLNPTTQMRYEIALNSTSEQIYTLEEVKNGIDIKDERDVFRFKNLHGIDITNTQGFDLVLNNGILKPEQTTKILLTYASALLE